RDPALAGRRLRVGERRDIVRPLEPWQGEPSPARSAHGAPASTTAARARAVHPARHSEDPAALGALPRRVRCGGRVVGFTCAICGRWHDEELLDVRAGVPEEVLALSEEEREQRVVASPDGDFTSIVDTDRHFVRGLIELPIDEGTRFGWGVWVRLDRHDVADVAAHRSDAAA